MESQPRLVRPREGRMLGGVCAGVARYLSIDVSLIRILWAATFFVACSGPIAYVLCWIIIPEE